MTHDERIEAMAKIVEAACDSDKPWNIFDTMQAAWAAADLEGMVREAAREGFKAGHVVQWGKGQSWKTELDAIVARVMQGAG